MPLNHLSFVPWSGVGIVMAFLRTNAQGDVGVGYDFGESTQFKIKRASSPVEQNTSRTTDRGVVFRMPGTAKIQVEIKTKTLPPFLEALTNRGSWQELGAGTPVVGWVAPTGMEVGMVMRLPSRSVSAVVVRDSTGTPKTLPVSQYQLDPLGGTIRILSLAGGPYVQPFKVDYTPGPVTVMGALAGSTADEWLLQFNGVNAYNDERKSIVCFRSRFNIEGEQDLIMDQFGEYTVMADLLKDEARLSTSVGGQYYGIYTP